MPAQPAGPGAPKADRFKAQEFARVVSETRLGRPLVEKDCNGCHVRQFGTPEQIYVRPDRRVRTPAQLKAQVTYCNTQLGTGYFPDEEEHIAAWLDPKSSGGMIIDMGIHDFDLARFPFAGVRTSGFRLSTNNFRIRLYSSAQLASRSKPWSSTG